MTASGSGAVRSRGRVNDRREAIVEAWVGGPRQRARTPCVIDTGCSGALALPESLAADLGLRYAGSVRARLADGSIVVLPRYEAEIEWADGKRAILASAVPAGNALVGTALLDGRRLVVDYAARTVEVA